MIDPRAILSALHDAYRAGGLRVLAGEEVAAEAGLGSGPELFRRAILEALRLRFSDQPSGELLLPLAPSVADQCESVLAGRALQLVLNGLDEGLRDSVLEVAVYENADPEARTSLQRELLVFPPRLIATTNLDVTFRRSASIFGCVRPIEDWHGAPVLAEELAFPDFAFRNDPADLRFREWMSGGDTVLLIGYPSASPTLRWILPRLPETAAKVILLARQDDNIERQWAEDRLFEAFNVAALRLETLVEAEPFLREVRFGPAPPGAMPGWADIALTWVNSHLTPAQALSGPWQALAQDALERLVEQIEMLFPCAPREQIQTSLLVPLQLDPEHPMLHLVSHSKVMSEEESRRDFMMRHSLDFRRDAEEGVSGQSFADGLVLDSSDEPEAEGANRGFSDAKRRDWMQGGRGYRDWRSILSVPLLDTNEWLPVAVIAINSNLGKPFWGRLSQRDLAELIAQMRRTAKLLIAEHGQGEVGKELEKLQGVRLPSAAERTSEKLVANIAEALMAPPRLANYKGYLCAVSQKEDGAAVAVEVQLRQDARNLSAEISIQDGVNEPQVEFQLELVGEGMRFVPYARPLVADAGGDSAPARFACTRLPDAPADQIVYIQLFQRNRLIHVLELPLV